MKALIAAIAVLVVLGVGFLLYSSPTAPPEMTEAEIAQIEAEVLAVMDVFMDGFNELDPDKLAGITHPEVTTFPWRGDLLNRADYREAIASWAENKVSWSGDWSDTAVRVLSADAAAFSGTYSATIAYTDGRTMHSPKGCIIALVERTPDGWKWSQLSGTSSGAQPVEGT